VNALILTRKGEDSLSLFEGGGSPTSCRGVVIIGTCLDLPEHLSRNDDSCSALLSSVCKDSQR
jgi:hypothetical protein